MAAAPAIAVIGTRKPSPEAKAFARELTQAVVKSGAVALSGGAVGIDTATHEAALEAGGRTWVIASTGSEHVFPRENEDLFRKVLENKSVMIWPFAAGTKASPITFFARNGVLAALADALVVIQAGAPSGTLNAVSWALRLKRPVWAVCAPPWISGFLGCASAVERGAKPLVSVASFLKAVGLAPAGRHRTDRPIPPPLPSPKTPSHESPLAGASAVELAILDSLSHEKGQHIDEIATKSRLSAAEVVTALLTLALENVVVEGPEGFFRRASAR
jgi:DNA processing protein